MSYLYYAIVSLLFILFQQSVTPVLPVFERLYDLLLPMVVYLGLHRPARESVPVILCLGFVMDSLSAGPFGLHVTSYFWLFAAIKGVTRFLHLRSSLLVLLVVPVGAIVENLLAMLTLTLGAGGNRIYDNALSTAAVQVLWALATGPVFLYLIERCHGAVTKWVAEVGAERGGM